MTLTTSASLILLLVLPIPLILKLLVCIIVSVWLCQSLREYCWHIGSSIQSAELRKDNTWLISIAGKEAIKAELLPDCLVQPWLTVLVFQLPDRRKKSLILLRDNIDPDTFRRVRVRLRNPM